MLHLDELIEQGAYEEYAVTFYGLFNPDVNGFLQLTPC